MDEKYFTIYWQGGTKNFIQGVTMEHAFNKQWGADVVKAIDFYDKGLDNAYFWDGKAWKEKEILHIHRDDFEQWVETLSEKDFILLLTKHFGIQVDFTGGDMMFIADKYGNYAKLGWVHQIEIFYGEFFTDALMGDVQPDDAPEGHMVTGTEHFFPNDYTGALTAFKQRVLSDHPSKPQTPTSVSLDVIARSNQKFI